MFLISLYQKLKPVRVQLLTTLGLPPHSCRHHPSCSQFAKEAINQYGTILGLYKGSKRILTCNPFFKSKN